MNHNTERQLVGQKNSIMEKKYTNVCAYIKQRNLNFQDDKVNKK
jgi:hypothetical protein